MRIFLNDGDRRLNTASGYGQVAAGLAAELPNLGHELIFRWSPEADIGLYVCPPSSIKPTAIPVPKVAMTMHELETLPESKRGWVDILNALDVVLTPTEWNRRVWRGLGVTTPVEVVPLGVDTRVFYPARPRTFSVLAVHENLGSASSRESWLDTLYAFCAAFGGWRDVELIIKTWKWKPTGWDEAVNQAAAELGLDAESTPAITVIDEDMSGAQMRALYQRCWLFVKNANREGWGLPASEAVSCGAAIAASRIEPLLTHLPEDAEWFDHGDRGALAEIFRRHCLRQRRIIDRATAYTWRRTAAAADRAIRAHLG